MKTNVTMTRNMGNFSVYQRTSDGMFNATSLLKQWNAFNNSKKELKEYFKLNSTSEFANTIAEKENLDGWKSTYHTSHANKGENAGTWMHPMLFIDFCMWINPSFKYDVLKFVYDQMIKYRNDAGDAYCELGASIQKIVSRDFMKTAMKKTGEAINWVIFNCHEQGMRNKVGEEGKQRDLYEFEHKIAELINDGFIKSYDELINYLRKQYTKRNYPKVFLK